MFGEPNLLISDLKIWFGVFSCNGIRHGPPVRLYRIAFQLFTVRAKDFQKPLKAFFNFIIANYDTDLRNPLSTPLMRKSFHSSAKPYAHHLVDFERRWRFDRNKNKRGPRPGGSRQDCLTDLEGWPGREAGCPVAIVKARVLVGASGDRQLPLAF